MLPRLRFWRKARPGGKWTARDSDGGLQTPQSERIQRTIKIKAKKVIVSCGTLQSPLLLMRSGLKNPHIGKNLYLHPTTSVRATFDKDVKGWEGGIITSVCTTFENLDGKGHGAKIETNVMLYPDPDDGRPRIAYTASAFDRGNLLTGVVGIVKLCYIQGATEIWTGIPGLPSFKRTKPPPPAGVDAGATHDEADFDQGINDPDFAAWVKLIEKTGLNSPFAQFACAHQMGSCRMSAKPQDGVVDSRGKVWGAQNLYVADASVFPSASGVNPMITNMAIADHISRGIVHELKSAGLRASL
ncbi:hypothetical protein NPX13_g11179 [Xylaria arbuscula]|uniref:Glucose-methanol-choline oxidoreductase N-terminal domain-containing protein n=1 Tax=Xylaria arbuscula TaxID=114810 RepID=A0A9W8TH66_9PEZI|nr:hypothetical protein NPX13_g11179 [Xylaria arbuscula]